MNNDEQSTPVTTNVEKKIISLVKKKKSFCIEDYADAVLRTILDKHPDSTIMIASRAGRVLTSTLGKRKTYEDSACIANFTDKARVLIRKLLNEDLVNVRIKGTDGKEIVVTFDEHLEIITIQNTLFEYPE